MATNCCSSLSSVCCTTSATQFNSGTFQILLSRPPSNLLPSIGCRNRKLRSHCRGSGIRASASNSSSGPEERIDVSRRHALLAALAFTVPNSDFLHLPRDSHAPAVDDEKTKIELIRYELKKVLTKGKSAGVLRLAFHDAGTFDSTNNSGGMNVSLLFELERPESGGLQRPIKALAESKNRA